MWSGEKHFISQPYLEKHRCYKQRQFCLIQVSQYVMTCLSHMLHECISEPEAAKRNLLPIYLTTVAQQNVD